MCGKTWWQWVLLNSTAIYHVIAETRAASVVTDFLQVSVALVNSPDLAVENSPLAACC